MGCARAPLSVVAAWITGATTVTSRAVPATFTSRRDRMEPTSSPVLWGTRGSRWARRTVSSPATPTTWVAHCPRAVRRAVRSAGMGDTLPELWPARHPRGAAAPVALIPRPVRVVLADVAGAVAAGAVRVALERGEDADRWPAARPLPLLE